MFNLFLPHSVKFSLCYHINDFVNKTVTLVESLLSLRLAHMKAGTNMAKTLQRNARTTTFSDNS